MRAEVGDRLRWVREAFEARQPGQHTQAAWAVNFGVSAASFSRWESGKLLPNLDALYRLVYLTGCDFNYVFFGVLSGQIVPWLRDELARAHPELHHEAEFFLVRDRTAGMRPRHHGRNSTRRADPRKSKP